MKRVKRTAVFAGAILIVAIGSFYVWLAVAKEPAQFWRKVGSAKVTSNGRIVQEARAYRRRDGMLLLDLGDNEWQWYRPDSGSMYLCNPIRHFSIPGYIYAMHCDSQFCPCVRMGGVKTEVDPKLVVETNAIEFTSFNHGRVRVSW